MSLSQDMNTSLVRACWNELFTLGMAQCAHVMNLSTILAAIINHLQGSIQDGKGPLTPMLSITKHQQYKPRGNRISLVPILHMTRTLF